MNQTFSIGELAEEFGVTTRTIRHYEDEGLLNPSRNGANRVFTARDRARLKLALRGKRLGFSLSEIRELFELYDTANEKKQLVEFLARLEKRRAHLEQQREDIEVMLNEINFFASQCRRLMGASNDSASSKVALE